MKSNTYSRLIIEKITFGALFASIAVVIKIFITFELPNFRLSFYEFPIMLSSILLGPLYGGLVGLVTDLSYIFTNPRGMNVGINWFTLECIAYGVLPGLFFQIFKYKPIKLGIIVFITMALGLYFNTLGILAFFDWGYMLASLPFRIIRDIVKFPAYIFLIHMFLVDQRFLSFTFFRRFSKKHRLHPTIF